jgi:hypothetical protein
MGAEKERTDKDRAIIRALVRIILTLEHTMSKLTCPIERMLYNKIIKRQRGLLTEARKV